MNKTQQKNKRNDSERSQAIVAGRNAVAEAIKSGREVEKVLVQKGAAGAASKVVALAKDSGITIERVEKQTLDRLFSGSHQGIIARVAAAAYSSVADILNAAKERDEDPFIIVLDGIEDPQNLGSIIRTAECAGAHGVIVGKNRAVGLTGTVAKASAGAVAHMKVARVTNISRTLEELKNEGLWLAACDMDGQDWCDADLGGAIALVIGSEGKGVSRLAKEKCDFVVSLPMKGNISSLNAANAASIIMYEVVRQRAAAVDITQKL